MEKIIAIVKVDNHGDYGCYVDCKLFNDLDLCVDYLIKESSYIYEEKDCTLEELKEFVKQIIIEKDEYEFDYWFRNFEIFYPEINKAD